MWSSHFGEKASLMLDDSPAIPRLGIKRFQWWSEALHGVANMGDVTVFPEPIGMAASFNDRMVYRVFDATSDEMRAKWNELQQMGGDVTRFHALSVWTPNVNIFRVAETSNSSMLQPIPSVPRQESMRFITAAVRLIRI